MANEKKNVHRYFEVYEAMKKAVPDGISMLPGWQASRGAQIENYTARHFPMQGISKSVTEEIERIK